MTADTAALYYSAGIVAQAIYASIKFLFRLGDKEEYAKMDEVGKNLPAWLRISINCFAVFMSSALWPFFLVHRFMKMFSKAKCK